MDSNGLDDFNLYWDGYVQFRKMLNLPANANSLRQFNQFLGGCDKVDQLHPTQDVRAKLQWMSGPHAKTLYKAWRAKHDLRINKGAE